jgi:hypothetical protein
MGSALPIKSTHLVEMKIDHDDHDRLPKTLAVTRFHF